MRLLARPGIGEAVTSAACLVVVLAALVAFDVRVRERFSLLIAPGSVAITMEQRVGAFGAAIVQVARERSVDHAPLLLFAVVGGVLLIFMLRT